MVVLEMKRRLRSHTSVQLAITWLSLSLHTLTSPLLLPSPQQESHQRAQCIRLRSWRSKPPSAILTWVARTLTTVSSTILSRSSNARTGKTCLSTACERANRTLSSAAQTSVLINYLFREYLLQHIPPSCPFLLTFTRPLPRYSRAHREGPSRLADRQEVRNFVNVF